MNPIVSPDVWMAHSHWSRRALAAGELGEMLTVSDDCCASCRASCRHLVDQPFLRAGSLAAMA
jgi:hypothetical protein